MYYLSNYLKKTCGYHNSLNIKENRFSRLYEICILEQFRFYYYDVHRFILNYIMFKNKYIIWMTKYGMNDFLVQFRLWYFRIKRYTKVVLWCIRLYCLVYSDNNILDKSNIFLASIIVIEWNRLNSSLHLLDNVLIS